jgi:ribosomal protein S18 acetylase RimI-like enzyme
VVLNNTPLYRYIAINVRMTNIGANMKISIEKVEISQVNDVVALFDGYRVFYGQPSNITAAEAFLTARLNNNESVIYLARDEANTPVGFTQLFPSFSSVSVQHSWILNDLFVSPDHRKKGTGKALLTAAKEFSVKTKAKGILLETAMDNVNAQALYESQGYHKEDDCYFYFLNTPEEK